MLSRRQQSAVVLPARKPMIRPGMGPVPQAPRAMVQRETPALESLLERIQRVEAEKLYPRLVLFKTLATFKDKSKQRQQSKDPLCEARRNFLDSFAYLCDTRKGEATVAATALQQLQFSDFLWLAANEGISDDILDYAKGILSNLKTATLENQSKLRDIIFRLAIEKCTPRIEFYKTQVRTYARKCRMELKRQENDDNGMKSYCYDLLLLTQGKIFG
jgi:hypothetical protein